MYYIRETFAMGSYTDGIRILPYYVDDEKVGAIYQYLFDQSGNRGENSGDGRGCVERSEFIAESLGLVWKPNLTFAVMIEAPNANINEIARIEQKFRAQIARNSADGRRSAIGD